MLFTESPEENRESTKFERACAQQLKEYFSAERKSFDVAVDLTGFSDFQKRVYRACMEVPWGEVCSYKELAARAGSAKAFRAVGQCMARNRLLLLMPCHRIIKSDHSLGHFSAGIERKAWLSEHEGVS
ncbi:MAG: methylated-DNA--[protein]-cysteine S-methyltransferase [Planctomycetes bacterium]|nr:methylated-DNA--[protein]-cysteine S-methyltransferase [Planctomycetota bacterium]